MQTPHSNEEKPRVNSASGRMFVGQLQDFTTNLHRLRRPLRYGEFAVGYGEGWDRQDVIADQFALPAMFTENDSTQYMPSESVVAIGEVKSTYSKNDIKQVSDCIRILKSAFFRPLITNTAYKGKTGNSDLKHVFINSPRKFLNDIFSFYLSSEGSEFDLEKSKDSISPSNRNVLPNMACFLNRGLLCWSSINKNVLNVASYPADFDEINGYSWRLLPMRN